MQNTQKVHIISEETAFEKKWLGISHITYEVEGRVINNYESVYRPNRKHSGAKLDGVQVIPIIKKKNSEPQLVFIANFRPAAGQFCVEFPAGLLESSNYQENALRQLQEETGYLAEKVLKLPTLPIHCDPWKSNEAGLLYVAIINGDDPKHQKKQDLDKDQNIRIFTLPVNNKLAQSLDELAKKNNYVIHTKVWAFCVGHCLSNYLNL